MELTVRQLPPEMDWWEPKFKFWRSVDIFSPEGSSEKEAALRTQILG